MRFKMTREMHIPKTYTMIVRAKTAPAVVHLSTEGKPAAMGFYGKADKPSFHFTYRSEERRAQHVAEFLQGCEARTKQQAERRAARKAFRHTLKVGDILSNSWGYDQTNTEFYEVVELIGDTLCVLRELACQAEQSGFLSESIIPMPGKYLERSKPLRRRVQEGNAVNIYGAGYGWATLYHRREPGKIDLMAPRHVSHTH